MSRPIEFRVWDKETERMFILNDSHDTFMFSSSGASYYNLQNGSGGAEYEIMQFTGLLDKNGVKIFEGDVLKCVSEKIKLMTGKPTGEITTTFKSIAWQEDWARFQFVEPSGKFSLLPSTKQEWVAEFYEVVGNIYEHSHLLTGGESENL